MAKSEAVDRKRRAAIIDRNIGQRLRAIRREAGWSQERLGEVRDTPTPRLIGGANRDDGQRRYRGAGKLSGKVNDRRGSEGLPDPQETSSLSMPLKKEAAQ